MESFNVILDEIMTIWHTQKEKATEAANLMDTADSLMAECEVLEAEMVAKLKEAKETDPEAYEEFMSSFGPQESENKNENLGSI